MAISDEAIIIKQYQALIRALIPYQQQNKLLEGLNKFSSRLPSRVRNVIKEEVLRLTSLTDAPADNSAFAQFPVMKFKHFGIQMKLDKVGQEILKRETAVYQDTYTVGVFESVTQSEYYQSHVRQQQQEKIVQAFMLQSQTMRDIDFGDDLALCPNFSVASPEFEKGKNCSIASLSSVDMVLETSRPPQLRDDGKEDYVFSFPDVAGLCGNGTEIKFVLSDISFNKATNKHESRFQISPHNDQRLLERLDQFVTTATTQVPLQRELEKERTLQDLERDRILAHSPWIPIFLSEITDGLVPVMALLTKHNRAANPAFESGADLPNKVIMQKAFKELLEVQETFVLCGQVKTKAGPQDIAATHRELLRGKLLGQFVTKVMETGVFRVFHFRLKSVRSEERQTAFGTHDILASDYPELNQLTHILYCRDVSQWITQLAETKPVPFRPFPKSFINNQDKYHLDILMEQELDRRNEPRYMLNKEASVKFSLLTSYEGAVVDISASGMHVKLGGEVMTPPDKVKVSIPSLKLKGERYQVVSFDGETGSLRLRGDAVKDSEKSLVGRLLDRNSQYFSARDIVRQQSNIHRFIWELAMRHVPSIAILTTQNRYTIGRLKTLYGCEDSVDMAPFSEFNHQASVHGFFADKGATKPKSQLLDQMLRNGRPEAHVIHCVRHKDKGTIYIDEQDFLFGELRQKIHDNICKDKITVYVTQITSQRCEAENFLTKKRLAQLSRIDKDSYEKLKDAQQGYTHVLYINNISVFHNALLRAGVVPLKSKKSSA
ncbi:PilZ domain-containing protein [Lacimicrobium sp. SS2-24]|uniref:PilZ domain-containing protein n=1 Tax=Lacimicrobium sp. SS2-24 TaxID=2005569 RepID=UPI000B4B7680|nr:PilZ domain-containing protein [Lacimicrobium sp. SS2-24]